MSRMGSTNARLKGQGEMTCVLPKHMTVAGKIDERRKGGPALELSLVSM